MATKGSRNGSMLKRQSQLRRKTMKKQEKSTSGDVTGEQGFSFNFTVDFKDAELKFKSETETMNTEEEEASKEGGVASKEVEEIDPEDKTFSPSRTIVSAVARNDAELLDELLHQEADENNTIKGMSRGAELQHALMLAISNKQCALVHKLLEAGTDLHSTDNAYPMLMMAMDIRANDIFHVLVQHAKTLKVHSCYGNLIHAAARTGDVELLKLVNEKLDGEGINDQAKGSGATPLHEAVKSVKFIQKEKPKSVFEFPQDVEWNTTLPSTISSTVSSTTRKKRSATNATKMESPAGSNDVSLENINKYGGYDTSCIHYLISKGCDINTKDKSGKTALHESAILGNLSVAKRLIEAGADKNIADSKDHTPVMYALIHKCNEALSELFIDDKTLHEPINSSGQYQIHLVCSAGNLAALKYLVSAGCDVNQQWQGKTPLMIAIDKEHFVCAQYLLSLPKCNIRLITPEGKSALLLLLDSDSKLSKRRSLLDSMIKRGVDVNEIFINNNATTPLSYSLQNSNIEWVQQLLEIGANVNMVGIHNEYPLLQACHANETDIVRMLLVHHADMTLTSRVSKLYENLTPLQLALRNENVPLVKLLLGAECSTKGTVAWFKTESGQTARDAFLPENKHIIDYIVDIEPVPLSLQELARYSIRKSTGVKKAGDKFGLLPLPSQIKKYLDVDTCRSEFNDFLDSLRDI